MGNRQTLSIGCVIADIHFGAFDPQLQYTLLKNNFIKQIAEYPVLDYIVIAGDLYDHKMMANSAGIMYASLFIDDVVSIAREKGSTVILIHGTFSHDANQLVNHYHYLNDPSVDFKVIETIQFVETHGLRMLCIPELYGYPEEEYQKYLQYSGYYDLAFLHGTVKGAVYGDNVGNGRLFDIHDFRMCKGIICCGHVHVAGCYEGYITYCGSFSRYRFGEEQEKGYLTTVLDKSNYRSYVHFNVVESPLYVTLDYDDLTQNDPKAIIDYINALQKDRGIDYLKIKFKVPISGPDKVIIDNYYRNNPKTFVEFLDVLEEKKIQDQKNGIINSEYDFILDPKLSDFDKFVMYVNQKEGYEFITVDKLKDVLEEVIT